MATTAPGAVRLSTSCVRPLAWSAIEEDWSRPDTSSKWVAGVCYPQCGVRIVITMKAASTAFYYAFDRLCGRRCAESCETACKTTVGFVRDVGDRALSMYNMWLPNREKYEEREYLAKHEAETIQSLLRNHSAVVNETMIKWRFSRFLEWLASNPWLANSAQPKRPASWTPGDAMMVRMRRRHYWPQSRFFQVGSRQGASQIDIFGRTEQLNVVVHQLTERVARFRDGHNRTYASSLDSWTWRRRPCKEVLAPAAPAHPVALARSSSAARSTSPSTRWRMDRCMMDAELCALARRAFAIDYACLGAALLYTPGIAASSQGDAQTCAAAVTTGEST